MFYAIVATIAGAWSILMGGNFGWFLLITGILWILYERTRAEGRRRNGTKEAETRKHPQSG